MEKAQRGRVQPKDGYRFGSRGQDGIDGGTSASFFLATPAIKKYATSVAVPTVSKEPVFDIDENGKLRLIR